jgi:preprotein translocase subunit SecA
VLANELYGYLYDIYKRKSKAIAEQALPVLQRIQAERGKLVEVVVIPFTDGLRQIDVPVNLQKSLETHGKHITESFDRGISLATIDELWKEHLREMDELKQSVQNAHLEQKDPLLIYKFEAYELFQQLLDKVNRQTLDMIFKAKIRTQDPEQVRQQRIPTAPRERVVENRGLPNRRPEPEEPPKTEPVRVGEKIGRNDACPCGSGKKYKHCHGINA